MEEIDFREKELPLRDWAGLLPTQTLLNSNLETPENFIQFCPSFKKLIMIFFNTDTQTPYKTNHPTTLYGYGWNFFYPIFSTSLKLEWACFACSLSFVWITSKERFEKSSVWPVLAKTFSAGDIILGGEVDKKNFLSSTF